VARRICGTCGRCGGVSPWQPCCSPLYYLEGDRRAIGRQDWTQARLGLVEALSEVFKPSRIPTKETLSGPDFMLLSGLTSFADWIGSNEDWFPFGSTEDCDDLLGWFQKRRVCADLALDAWYPDFSVLYDGILTVTVPDKFKDTLQSGVGHGKIMGLGLLSIVPIA
jgi:hypothetical protein